MALSALAKYLTKAAAKGFTERIYHATPRAGEIKYLSTNPKQKINKEGRKVDSDVGIHVGSLDTAEARAMDENTPVVSIKNKLVQKTKPDWSIMPLVADTNVVKNSLQVPDMGMFSSPTNWLQELTGYNLLLRSRHQPKRKGGMFYTHNQKAIFPEGEAIKIHPDMDIYVRMPAEFKYSDLDPKDYKIIVQTIFKDLFKNKKLRADVNNTAKRELLKQDNPKWATHALGTNPELEQVSRSSWIQTLKKILRKTKKDAFKYENIWEVGEKPENSYMLLDPRKIKSLFAKDFDKDSHILTKYEGGLLVEPRRDYTRIRGI